MKKMMFAAFLLPLILSACYSSLPPLCYQQIYRLDGVRTEADRKYDKGTPIPVPGFKTELQKLYEAYPAAVRGKISDGAYRLGWYFNQNDLTRFTGEAIGDLCNHAAWFVLNCIPEAERSAYAERIAKLMADFEEEKTVELLKELKRKAVPGHRIVVSKTFYDKNEPDHFKTTTEIAQGRVNGKENPRYGLHRAYHPSGMIAMEVFYYNDVPTGYAFCYTPEGRIRAVYRYDGKGVRTQCFGGAEN